MSTWKKNNLNFTSVEKRALWLISILFCFGIAIPRYLAYRDTSKITILTHEEDSLIRRLQKENPTHRPKHYYYNQRADFEEKTQQPNFVLQAFNPDTLSKEQWQQLGLTEKQSVALMHYKNAIHGFHTYEDFANAYTLDSVQIAQWKPYLVFTKAKIIPIELNTVTEEKLIQLKGIGPFLAKQIIQYREQLGGYITVQQLQEVYKLSPEIYAVIKEDFAADQSKIIPLKINSIDTKELSKHPYLTYNQANSLVEYRKQHGYYHAPKDLMQSKLITEEDLVKLTPYLNFSTP